MDGGGHSGNSGVIERDGDLEEEEKEDEEIEEAINRVNNLRFRIINLNLIF